MTRSRLRGLVAATLAGIGAAMPAWADNGALTVLRSATDGAGGVAYSVPLQLLLLMTALTLLPSMLLAMTAFTRIIIVLAILRQALGTAQMPPNQILIGIALAATAMVMAPTIERLDQDSVRPYLSGAMAGDAALASAASIMKTFMVRNTRNADLLVFADLVGDTSYATPGDVPLTVAMPAFVASELRAAFEIGFMLFVPFLVVDLVVASVLMSLGMMMVSPMLISLPIKLLLFVAVDGWALTIGSLVRSYAS